MVALAIMCTCLGIFFQQELAKHYNEYDTFMNTVPRLLSIGLLTLGGVFWTFYFLELWRYG
ncbi:MAG: hypothetical protein GOVbin1096_102 [Prokaryotic dsDNA virus sp.]|jgi:hypothetical protein|nr:MAG: hypothetical protein GOVbin1096_102 [Prokaryotic dsDNA virus sp.]